MSPPGIGELRHRMQLEAPVRTDDGAGGAAVSWALEAEVWGAMRPLAGSEIVDADRLAGRVTHEIWIRYRAGVTPQMRLVLGTRPFDIRTVLDEEERHRWLRCLVEERVS